MAHANFHMAVGMSVGVVATLVPVARAWLAKAPVARPVARLLVISYALGVWALVPTLVSAAGGPAGIHHARWADLFVLHASIDAREPGGLLKGELIITTLVVLQYALLVAALVRARRRPPPER